MALKYQFSCSTNLKYEFVTSMKTDAQTFVLKQVQARNTFELELQRQLEQESPPPTLQQPVPFHQAIVVQQPQG